MQLHLIDYAIMVIYVGFVVGIGFALKRYMRTSADFFLSGRSIPACVCGLAFLSANLGALELMEVRVPGTGALLGSLGDQLLGELFWDAWQENAAVPVAGWFGNNILNQHRLTIDYPNRISHWLKRSEPDPSELDQVGVTLGYNAGEYSIGGIVGRNGQPTAEGLMAGDRLLQIDGQRIDGWPRERVLSVLHGKPGESRRLVVERNNRMIE